MEESQEQRHVCKICGKSCVNGRSLGGHMRVHLAQISASKKAAESEVANGMDSEFGVDQNAGFRLEKKSKNQSNSTYLSIDHIKNCHSNTDYGESDPSNTNSYELRENPKKSWRISNPKCGVSRKAAACKVCYKRFKSLRALSGHMRFHSTKSKGFHQCRSCGKAFDSIRAMFGHMKSHSKKLSRAHGESSNNSLDLGNLGHVRKKRSSLRYEVEANPEVSSLNASSSAVFEFDEEQDAAVCLLMLSIGVTESSYHDSVYFQAGSFSRTREIDGSFACHGDKISSILTTEKLDHCISGSGASFSKIVSEFEGLGSIKLPKMLEGSSVPIKPAESDKGSIMATGIQETDSESLKSLSCKKERLSVHDLENDLSPNGPSDLKIAKNSEKQQENRRKMLDKNFKSHRLPSNTSSVATNAGQLSVIKHADQVEHNGIQLAPGTKDHQCLTCFKFFGSGQALGGHRRAHYGVFTESKTEERIAGDQQFGVVDNFIDLNFPLTFDEGTNDHVGLNLWRFKRHEALALIN